MPASPLGVAAPSNQDLIHLPFSRDPSHPPKKLPTESNTSHQSNYNSYTPQTYNRQGYGCIQDQAWHDNEAPASRNIVYKKKPAPPTPNKVPSVSRQPTPAPRSTVNNNTSDDWQFPKLTKTDRNKNIYGGSMPNDMNNPIKELQQLAGSRDSIKGDDPPFNFQAMLRKTPRNRASMKRTGESPLSVPIDSYSQVVLPAYFDNNSKPPTPDHGKGKAPPRPKSCQGFKRKDSAERFKMTIKRTDSSQGFVSALLNGNNGETVELAPGITVEGYVIDL